MKAPLCVVVRRQLDSVAKSSLARFAVFWPMHLGNKDLNTKIYCSKIILPVQNVIAP